MPVQPESKKLVQPVRRSKCIQDQLPDNYFQRPRTTANIRRNALYRVLATNAMFDTSAHSNVPDNLMNSKLNMSSAIDLEALQ